MKLHKKYQSDNDNEVEREYIDEDVCHASDDDDDGVVDVDVDDNENECDEEYDESIDSSGDIYSFSASVDKNFINFDQSAENIVFNLYKLTNKVRSIVKVYKQSSIVFSYFYNYVQSLNPEESIQSKGLIHDFIVRWNSTYLMLLRIVEFMAPINHLTSEPDSINGQLLMLPLLAYWF